MNERPTIHVAVLEVMEDITLADIPEGKTILLTGKPTEVSDTTFKSEAPVIEKWTDEDGRTRALGKYATVMYDTSTQELSLTLPNQEITGLRRSGAEDQNYITFTAEESNKG